MCVCVCVCVRMCVCAYVRMCVCTFSRTFSFLCSNLLLLFLFVVIVIELMAAGGRLMTGESLFITHFTNESEQKCRVAFAAPYPGSIVPVNLADQFGQSITCRKYEI